MTGGPPRPSARYPNNVAILVEKGRGVSYDEPASTGLFAVVVDLSCGFGYVERLRMRFGINRREHLEQTWKVALERFKEGTATAWPTCKQSLKEPHNLSKEKRSCMEVSCWPGPGTRLNSHIVSPWPG